MRRLPAQNAARKPPAAIPRLAAPSPNVAIPNAPNPAADVLSPSAVQMRDAEMTCHGTLAQATTTPVTLKDRVTNLPAAIKSHGMPDVRTTTINRVANVRVATSAPINTVPGLFKISARAHAVPKCTARKPHAEASTPSADVVVENTLLVVPIVTKAHHRR